MSILRRRHLAIVALLILLAGFAVEISALPLESGLYSRSSKCGKDVVCPCISNVSPENCFERPFDGMLIGIPVVQESVSVGRTEYISPKLISVPKPASEAIALCPMPVPLNEITEQLGRPRLE